MLFLLRLNPLRHVGPKYAALAASGLMEVFKKMWPEAWGVRMEHILRNVLMALIEQPAATVHDILRVFSDSKFRKEIARSLQNEPVRRFLEHEFEKFSFGYRADGVAPIQNKVGAFLADPRLNNILSAPRKELHIRRIMDEGKVLLINLAKGRIGEDSSSLLGGLLVTTIGLAAYTRAELDPTQRRDFFVYIDEFQSFTTLALANMLSELRKYRVGFTIAHQYLHQLTPDIRHAVLGNAGTIISLRVGAEDAPYGDADLRRLTFIRRCRDFGFSIEQIRQLVTLTPDRDCAAARDLVAVQLDEVRRKLKECRALERTLQKFVDECNRECAGGPARTCVILEDLAAAKQPSCCASAPVSNHHVADRRRPTAAAPGKPPCPR